MNRIHATAGRVRNIERCGGKKRWLYHHAFLLTYRLGGSRHWNQPDWKRVTRLLFVCKGNICRSPYAEVRAQSLGFSAVSFGLLPDPGARADPAASRIASTRGVDLTTHRSRALYDVSIAATDLLIGMEPWHVRDVAPIAVDRGAQVYLLGLLCPKLRPYIWDPFGQSDTCFEVCFDDIDAGIETLLQLLKSNETTQVDSASAPRC